MTLPGYDHFSFEHEGTTKTVYCKGEGPAVVIMHEIPGITPEVQVFAERVEQEGFRVYLPHLFGTPGRRMTAGYSVAQIARACISREFHVLAARGSSPVTHWLRALCRKAHADCGGPGVGAIGMCLTGNFALALMVDPCVMAPVLSQPSLPFPILPGAARALHLSDEDLATVRQRTQAGCPLLGLRFSGDALSPGRRFQRLREELGDAFEGIEIDSSRGNAHGIKGIAHSVVTNDLVDEEGHPTRAALDRVLALFRDRLIES